MIVGYELGKVMKHETVKKTDRRWRNAPASTLPTTTARLISFEISGHCKP